MILYKSTIASTKKLNCTHQPMIVSKQHGPKWLDYNHWITIAEIQLLAHYNQDFHLTALHVWNLRLWSRDIRPEVMLHAVILYEFQLSAFLLNDQASLCWPPSPLRHAGCLVKPTELHYQQREQRLWGLNNTINVHQEMEKMRISTVLHLLLFTTSMFLLHLQNVASL